MRNILLCCALLTALPAAACDNTRYVAYTEQFIIAGNECQQFVRQFGPDMWQGEACLSMERWRVMADRETCKGTLKVDMQQRINWLKLHLRDVGYKL